MITTAPLGNIVKEYGQKQYATRQDFGKHRGRQGQDVAHGALLDFG